MKPVDPAEISALLDGELPPQRAAEVRRAIAADAELAALHAQLSGLDRELMSLARACEFEPNVSLAPVRPISYNSMWFVAMLLLSVRIAAKVLPFVPAVGLQAAAFVLLSTCLVYWLMRTLRNDGVQWEMSAH
jgi:anti-sigma factor RsiW